ncbi:unnamed protein product [Parnassius mnemosyne]|uniref:Centrosomal protein of 135 kDa n=1 Tax=Parnassius mnemosyne TaxID=213953 RepID=A0AAV1KTJ4_9NEOP
MCENKDLYRNEKYFDLKQKLEALGYNYTLSIDAVPLVECVIADLLQTTRSLQHYMDLCKEVLQERDSLIMEVEPYKCDNAKLISENNQLHKEIIQLKEENMKLSKENKRRNKCLTDELIKKDTLIIKLQHDLRDLSLRNLCTSTQSTRSKSKRKEEETPTISNICVCNNTQRNTDLANNKHELCENIQLLKEKNEALCDEILLLKSQVEHRDNEIVRLKMLLEGGRPIPTVNKVCSDKNANIDQSIIKQLNEIKKENDALKKEINIGLEKQHEAMLRALTLADKNKVLEEELLKVDKLALTVEKDCNNRLAVLKNELTFLQSNLESLKMKNSELEKELSEYRNKENCIQESFNLALKEKDVLQKEIKDLIDINRNLQDKIVTLSQINKSYYDKISTDLQYSQSYPKCLQKDDLQKLLMDERERYEKYMNNIQEKLSEALDLFNKYTPEKLKKSCNLLISPENAIIRDLHNRLCESEQKILMLKKENDELKCKSIQQEDCNKQNFKDIIKHLNIENAQLTKENIYLSQQISQYKMHNSAQQNRDEYTIQEYSKLKEKNEVLLRELDFSKKDKHEYQMRYNELTDLVEKLKRDLALKQKQIEHLEEENCAYKMTNRTGKASAEQLREECDFLKEQIKKIQNDVIKEKTLASQIKHIQIETERNSSEIHDELLSMQKKLSISRENIGQLEKKCKELQSEINSLKNDKSNLIENIKSLDQERDKLVIELDNKTESISSLEQKINNKVFEISKLENENAELKRKLNLYKTSEYKLSDYESQIMFLNSEIQRLTQKYDNATIENKHLQNSLADANGTLKLTKLELEKSKKDVDSLKQQLQHYVTEVRRIEELLSQKEAERSDMLEQFASLSVEANILENTNHSLESESASKSIQLQTYVNKIQSLEAQLMDKDNVIDSQSAQISTMTCKISKLENEIRLISDEKKILDQNVSHLKQMCNNLKVEQSNNILDLKDTDSELKIYENKIKSLTTVKIRLQMENDELKDKLNTTEKLLLNARREIVELKLALQDATSETKSLQDCVSRLSRREPEVHEHTLTDIELPPTLGETIDEIRNEDEDSVLHGDLILYKSYSKHSHGSTI